MSMFQDEHVSRWTCFKLNMFQDEHDSRRYSRTALPAGNAEQDMCSDIGFLVVVMHHMNGDTRRIH